jgi:23S rRNA (guanosine2251-2'-O)-methyltransferase
VIVSGFHPVREALLSRPAAVEAVLLQRGRRDARMSELETVARSHGIAVRIVGKDELDRLAGKAHNGAAARVAVRGYDSEEECLAGSKGSRRVLFLDGVTDPGNLGAIVRTAAAFGAAVVLPERHAAPLSETVAKASAGAVERVRVTRVGNTVQFLTRAKDAGFWVFGADADGEKIWGVDLTGDIVLCLGAEGTGLRRLTREACDRVVGIPLLPGSGSLNVGVAAALILFESLRQGQRV